MNLGRFRDAEEGQAVLEFALFASLFVIILVGVTDLSFYLIAAMSVQEAATEGAAYGASPGNQNDNSGMVTWASQAAVGVAPRVGARLSNLFHLYSGGRPGAFDHGLLGERRTHGICQGHGDGQT